MPPKPVFTYESSELAHLPEPDHRRARGSLAADLLAELPEPDLADKDLAERVAKIAARLDRLQEPPAIDDGLGIDL